MSDGQAQPQAEPSMEEILASIRRIISEDEQESEQPAAPEPQPEPAAPAPPEPVAEMPAEPEPEPDVLELTDIVDETAEAPPPEPEPEPEPMVLSRPAPEPEEPVEVELRDAPPPRPEAEESRLVGRPAAQASMDSLSALAAVMERQRTGPAIGDGGRTIEDLVKEVMRPMIREWLDVNLPSLVERLVDREIARIARRAEDTTDQ